MKRKTFPAPKAGKKSSQGNGMELRVWAHYHFGRVVVAAASAVMQDRTAVTPKGQKHRFTSGKFVARFEEWYIFLGHPLGMTNELTYHFAVRQGHTKLTLDPGQEDPEPEDGQ